MKAIGKKALGFLLIAWFIASALPLQAQESAAYITISGTVKDKQSKKRLENVNISVPGTNIGTVTNADGVFSIKIDKHLSARQVEISHIGFLDYRMPIDNKELSTVNIQLTPNANVLDEVIVRANDPLLLVEAAIRKIPDNYSTKDNRLTGFYRETAQKGRRYINLSEAVIDIFKTSYNERIDNDRVQLFKGRRLLSQKASDTLVVKLLGGPNLSVFLDVVKNPDILLDPASLSCYTFRMEEATTIGNRPHYVISFQPQVLLPYALYYGKLYIDKEKLAFSRAEFSLSMDDQNKATQAILKKKPFGLRFKPVEVSFLVTYKQRDERSYLSYIRNEVRFKCDWKRKLFSTSYTIISEMVVTDGKDQNVSKIPYKESFKISQSLSDKVTDFMDENFWGSYNIIEPTESLETAVYKLKKQQK
ncbi:MAG: carboxypeptidase-like regulatory domain-containing protein [Tannerellaceae bacterium]